MPRHLLVQAALLASFSCSDAKKPGPSRPVPIVSVIATDAERIGGRESAGKVGDFLLQNDRVRFVVEDVDASTGFGLYGGSLVDLDRVRAVTATSTGEGDDRLQEIFVQCDLRAFDPVRSEIVAAGGPDEPGILRLIGVDQGIPFLDSIVPSQPLGVEISVDFVLPPKSQTLELIVRAKDTLRLGSRDLACGLVLLTGDGYQGFVQGPGFALDEVSSEVDYIAAASDESEVSFVLFRPEGRLSPIAAQAEITPLAVPRKGLVEAGSVEERFLLSAGLRGDIESALQERRNHVVPPTPLSRVEIMLDAGQVLRPFRGKTELTFLDQSRREGAQALTSVRVDPATGRGIVDLPSGTYRVEIELNEVRQAAVELVVPEASAPPTQLVAGLSGWGILRTSTFKVDLAGENRTATPVRLTILTGAVPDPRADGEPHYVGLGDRVLLPAQEVTVVASLGPEFELDWKTVRIPENGEVEVELVVRRAVDTSGWVAADLHVHGTKSADANPSKPIRVLGAIAEGLDILVATDHDVVSDYGPTAKKLGLSHLLHTVVGSEISALWGHTNGFPLQPSTPERAWPVSWFIYEQGVYQRMMEPIEVVRSLRELGAEIVQANHPRSGQGVWSYLELAENGAVGRGEFPAPDTMEILNGKRLDDYSAVFRDLNNLTRAGKRVTATGVSDSHGAFKSLGYARTMIASASDDPAALDESAIWTALRQGRAIAMNGPFVRFSAERGAERYEMGDVVAARGLAYDLVVQVEAPSWMSAAKLTVFRDGSPWIERSITSADSDPNRPSIRARHTFTTTTATDTFYVVVVEGEPGRRNLPVLDDPAITVTNPILIDADGDGFRMR